MNSFDVFDTLIARWYIDDADYQSTGDFDTELRHTYPIIENVEKIRDDSLIISDTYFSEEQVKQLLEKNGIINYGGLYVSYDDKWTGKAWKAVSTQHHLGDNVVSDVEVPRRFGIQSTHYRGSSLTETESYLYNNGYKKLAGLIRAVRLSNPHTSNEKLRSIWHEQSQINIPVLILVSNFISKVVGYDKILFTQRDCKNLLSIFSALYPEINAIPFYTSRELYYNPTARFTTYVAELLDGRNLIVDLQGTSRSLRSFTNMGDYFTVVYSDLDRLHDVSYLLDRHDGYTDKIERLNYGLFSEKAGAPFDGTKTIFEPYLDIISTQRSAIHLATKLILDGFKLEKDFDLAMLRFLMQRLENECVVCKYVNHEEM